MKTYEVIVERTMNIVNTRKMLLTIGDNDNTTVETEINKNLNSAWNDIQFEIKNIRQIEAISNDAFCEYVTGIVGSIPVSELSEIEDIPEADRGVFLNMLSTLLDLSNTLITYYEAVEIAEAEGSSVEKALEKVTRYIELVKNLKP